MKSTNRKRREFTANPDNPKQRAREQRQPDVLRSRAQGESTKDACALVGVTRFAYEQSDSREKEVHTSVAIAHDRKPATRPIQTIQTNSTPSVHGEPHAESAGYTNPNTHGGTVKFFKNPDKTDPGQASASPHALVGSRVRNQIFHGSKVVGE
jgi:hypothetical protein